MKEIFQLAELLTGIFGIGLSMYAAYKLFKQITGLGEIKPLDEANKKVLKKMTYIGICLLTLIVKSNRKAGG